MTVAFAHCMARLPPRACSSKPHQNQSGVPGNANEAAVCIQTAVRTALAMGKRRLRVDLLVTTVDDRTRLYDEQAAQNVFNALVTSVQPLLPDDNHAQLQVVVCNSAHALRIRRWLADKPLPNVSITLLGLDALPHLQPPPTVESPEQMPTQSRTGALLVLNPSSNVQMIEPFRALLSAAHERSLPVLVHNHPREDAVYQLVGFGGPTPIEMWKYEQVFAMVPFQLQIQTPSSDSLSEEQELHVENMRRAPPRFVLLRQFPNNWALWHYRRGDSTADGTNVNVDDSANYHLCESFDVRPSDEDVMESVKRTMTSYQY